MKLNNMSSKIKKVVGSLITMCLLCTCLVTEVKAGYHKDIVEHGDGRHYDIYEVTTTKNDKTHKIEGTRVYHSHKQAKTTITVKKGYSHTKKCTAETGVGMSKGILSVEQKWGFTAQRTFKYDSSIAFTLDRKTPEGYYSAGMIFPGVEVREVKYQCVRTGNTLPFENVQITKDTKKKMIDRVIAYVPNQQPAKKLIVN